MANDKDKELENQADSAIYGSAADAATGTEMFSDVSAVGAFADGLDNMSHGHAPAPDRHNESGERREAAEKTEQTNSSEAQGAAPETDDQKKQWKEWGAEIQTRAGGEAGQGEAEQSQQDNDSAEQSRRHYEMHRQKDDEQEYCR